MNDASSILDALARGEPADAGELLALVYEELRKLAARQLQSEKPGQTLDATALVHEAFLRLVGNDAPQRFQGRRHFYGAAAEAMRRILVESARRKNRVKHGGGRQRVELTEVAASSDVPELDLPAIDEALDALAAADPKAAEVVKLHFFAGLTMDVIADVRGVSVRTVHREWAFARAWLFDYLKEERGTTNCTNHTN